jgi:hypothetical protein
MGASGASAMSLDSIPSMSTKMKRDEFHME